MININFPFFLGAGGIGDCLLLLSTFYDDVEKANVVFLANEPQDIKELLGIFPKIKSITLLNNWETLKELYYHKNCIGTGILPKDLNYHNWYKVDIFKEFKVNPKPNFVNLFEPIVNNDKQLFIQTSGSQVENEGKKRILLGGTIQNIQREFIDKQGYKLANCLDLYTRLPRKSLSEIFSLIRGSKLVIGVDSFCKTFSTLCGIKTIVYDNIYSSEYLNSFRDRIDAGHFVFLFPWPIELRQQ